MDVIKLWLMFAPGPVSFISFFSSGGGGAAELGVHPGQSDLPQEVPCLRGGEHAGEEATALSL